MKDWRREPRPCNDCGAEIGQPHADGCDIARCMMTGGQRLQCEPEHEHPAETRAALVAVAKAAIGAYADGMQFGWDDVTSPLTTLDGAAAALVDAVDTARYASCGHDVWTGQFPGNEDAAALGLWSYWGPDYGERGWVECDDRPDHPGARPDLNRLRPPYARWDRESGHWVAP